jgi:hypothetical protein
MDPVRSQFIAQRPVRRQQLSRPAPQVNNLALERLIGPPAQNKGLFAGLKNFWENRQVRQLHQDYYDRESRVIKAVRQGNSSLAQTQLKQWIGHIESCCQKPTETKESLEAAFRRLEDQVGIPQQRQLKRDFQAAFRAYMNESMVSHIDPEAIKTTADLEVAAAKIANTVPQGVVLSPELIKEQILLAVGDHLLTDGLDIWSEKLYEMEVGIDAKVQPQLPLHQQALKKEIESWLKGDAVIDEAFLQAKAAGNPLLAQFKTEFLPALEDLRQGKAEQESEMKRLVQKLTVGRFRLENVTETEAPKGAETFDFHQIKAFANANPGQGPDPYGIAPLVEERKHLVRQAAQLNREKENRLRDITEEREIGLQAIENGVVREIVSLRNQYFDAFREAQKLKQEQQELLNPEKVQQLREEYASSIQRLIGLQAEAAIKTACIGLLNRNETSRPETIQQLEQEVVTLAAEIQPLREKVAHMTLQLGAIEAAPLPNQLNDAVRSVEQRRDQLKQDLEHVQAQEKAERLQVEESFAAKNAAVENEIDSQISAIRKRLDAIQKTKLPITISELDERTKNRPISGDSAVGAIIKEYRELQAERQLLEQEMDDIQRLLDIFNETQKELNHAIENLNIEKAFDEASEHAFINGDIAQQRELIRQIHAARLEAAQTIDNPSGHLVSPKVVHNLADIRNEAYQQTKIARTAKEEDVSKEFITQDTVLSLAKDTHSRRALGQQYPHIAFTIKQVYGTVEKPSTREEVAEKFSKLAEAEQKEVMFGLKAMEALKLLNPPLLAPPAERESIDLGMVTDDDESEYEIVSLPSPKPIKPPLFHRNQIQGDALAAAIEAEDGRPVQVPSELTF